MDQLDFTILHFLLPNSMKRQSHTEYLLTDNMQSRTSEYVMGKKGQRRHHQRDGNWKDDDNELGINEVRLQLEHRVAEQSQDHHRPHVGVNAFAFHGGESTGRQHGQNMLVCDAKRMPRIPAN